MTELTHLINAWLDNELTEPQMRKLSAFLREDRRNVQDFAQQVELHYLLHKTHFIQANLPLAAPVPLGAGSGDADCRPAHRPPARRAFRYGLWAVMASAMVLIVPLSWLMLRGSAREDTHERQWRHIAADERVPTPLEAEIAHVASITGIDHTRYRVGQRLASGERLQIERGEVTLRFAIGARVQLVGPVDLEFVSPSRAVLHRGQLTATVDESGRGFTVATPYADVIDLGTCFGVNVGEAGNADVVAFEGQIEIAYTSDGGGLKGASGAVERLGLSVGEAVRIDGSGGYFRVPVIEGSQHLSWSPGIRHTRSSLITKLSDNIPATDRPIYYSIIPGGFDEDARAYLDRPHEWNSIAGTSFPEELRGRDYIRLRNDLKFALNLKVTLEFAQPATIYVLFDERVPPPAWLRQGFTRTDLRIGVDECYAPGVSEGQWAEGILKPLGRGPGNSVDTAYAIWARHCPEDEPVVLGSMIDAEFPPASNAQADSPLYVTALSMYGVVVAPYVGEPPPLLMERMPQRQSPLDALSRSWSRYLRKSGNEPPSFWRSRN